MMYERDVETGSCDLWLR